MDITPKMEETYWATLIILYDRIQGALTWIVIRKKTLKNATALTNPVPERGPAANASPIIWT